MIVNVFQHVLQFSPLKKHCMDIIYSMCLLQRSYICCPTAIVSLEYWVEEQEVLYADLSVNTICISTANMVVLLSHLDSLHILHNNGMS